MHIYLTPVPENLEMANIHQIQNFAENNIQGFGGDRTSFSLNKK